MNSDSQHIRLHCSQLTKWAQCEKRQFYRLYHPGQWDDKAQSIAAFVGTSVHALVAGSALPERPQEIVFDQLTPSWMVADGQISIMADEILREISHSINPAAEVQKFSEYHLTDYRESHWPLNVFLSGVCDLYLTEIGRHTITDIKTGAHINSSWLQLGAYKMMLEGMYSTRPVSQLGVIHCPRPDILAGEKPHAKSRWNENPEQCAEEARTIIERIISVITSRSLPVASPATHCNWCDHETCAVRKIT